MVGVISPTTQGGMDLASPNRYVRHRDEEIGSGGEGRNEDEIRVSDDAFDIPSKNAPIERLRRWRVCMLFPQCCSSLLLIFFGIATVCCC